MNYQTTILQQSRVVLIRFTRLKSVNSKLLFNLANLKVEKKMPRDNKFIAEAQKQRLRIKEKGARYVPGTVNLQILGNGAAGTPAAVYMFTDQQRYLFNCGEGTQRLAHEHKTKLSRLEHIFITRTEWDRIGGLPGLSLTVQDVGVPKLTLHGPSGLDKLFKSMQNFVVLKELRVEAPECNYDAIYDDSVMTLRYVPLVREKTSSSDNNTVISYVCKLKSRPGALDLEKCVEKGVPPGPLLGQLKNGNDVLLPNGNLVCANDVRGKEDPGVTFIFLDIPSTEYLDALEKNSKAFELHQACTTSETDLASLLIHFTPKNIFDHPKYQAFLDKFSPSTQHLVLNESNELSGYFASHRIQFQLNQLNPSMFPILKEAIEFSKPFPSKKFKLEESPFSSLNGNQSKIEVFDKLNGTNVSPLTSYYLRPRKGLDSSTELTLNPEEYIRETAMIPGFLESLQNFRDSTGMKIEATRIGRDEVYPKVLFLGTGSCIPNKTRNVSSILVNTNSHSSVLLDCGEGTWGQMVRYYGLELAKQVLKNTKVIYISHLHADHHIGLIGLLQMRRRILEPATDPIILLAPQQISKWLEFYHQSVEPIANDYVLIPNGELLERPLHLDKTHNMSIESISTCLVRHCPHAFGLTLRLQYQVDGQQFKITYSGDTMPSNELVQLGMGSTILIHEATMEDELKHEARIKTHSTVSEAIEQGRLMNAKYTILTHFSQRYAKLPRIENALDRNVSIAFDNMEVTLGDLENFYEMYPTLKLLFSDHCEEMEKKAVKRANRQRLTAEQLHK